MRERLEVFGEKYPWFGLALAVQNRYSELKGNYLAAAVTMMGFISLFPLLLIGIAVLGFVSSSSTDLASKVVSELSLTGQAATLVRDSIAGAERSRRAASVVGFLGLLWAGLGLVGALQQAMNTSWQVQGRGLKDKLTGLAWLGGTGLLFLASFGVVTLIRVLPGIFAPLNVVAAFALDVALWLWMMHVLPNRRLGWRPLLPGAVLGAVGLEVLKVAGTVYVPHAVASSSSLYGSLGVVFAILLWLLLFGKLFVYACVLNVVLWERAHGTEIVDVEVPRLPGEPPGAANRSGETVVTGS